MASDTLVPIVPKIQGEIIAHSVVTLIVLVVVGIRLLGRVRGIGLGWDDGLVVIATLAAVTLLAMEGVWATLGEGYNLVPTEPHFPELVANTPQILKMLVGFTLVYLQALALVKCSALAFYLRMFPSPRMQLIVKLSIGMTVVWVVAHDLALIFLCKPVEYQWNRQIPTSQKPTCGDQLSYYTSVVTTNIVSDFWIMGLPMYTIWHLKMRTTEKIGLTLCFLLGLGTVGLSAGRLANVYSIAVSTNLTGTMDTAVLLGILEVNFGILAISIPLLRPFYRRYRQKMSSSRLNDGSDNQYKDYEISAGSKNKLGTTGSSKQYAPGTVVDEAWEMNGYATTNANNSNNSFYGDNAVEDTHNDSGSQKRLTSRKQPSTSRIFVKTDWTVSQV